MKSFKYLLLILMLIVFKEGQSQYIFNNATIYSVDSSSNLYEAMAVMNGKIVALGKTEDLKKQYPSYELKDMKGKFIYPGFIDAHCHFLGLGLSMQMVDLRNTKSLAEVIQKCVEYDKKNPSSILFGRGWDQNDWADKNFPDNEQLNKLFPNKIVILKRIDGHAALCNDYVLQKAGITHQKMIDGGEVMMKNNKPSGVLIDNAVDLVMKYVPALDEQYILSSMKLAQTECFKYGLTTVVDAGLELDTLMKIKNIYEKNLMDIRFSGMFSMSTKCFDYIFRTPLKITTLGNYHNPNLGNYFAVKGIKIYADGALGSRGACLKEAYADRENHVGFFLTTWQQYSKWIPLAYKKNLQLNVHCIGDSASAYVMRLMGNQLKTTNDRRWRIEHAQVMAEPDFSYFKKYSIIPSVQPTHATSDMPWAVDRLGQRRLLNAYAYKKLLNVSKFIALGTDFPVEEVSTFKTFYAAVVRKDADGNPEQGFQAENALTRQETLKGMTIWAAQSVFEEKNRGSLEVGKWADFVVLDQDILFVEPSKLLKTKVLYTFVGGKLVYKAE